MSHDFSSFFPFWSGASLRGLHPIKTDCGHYHHSDTHIDPKNFEDRMARRVFAISPEFAEIRKKQEIMNQHMRKLHDENAKRIRDIVAEALGIKQESDDADRLH